MTDQDSVNAAVWAAYSRLRSALDAPQQALDHTVALLFLKHVNDFWNDRCGTYRQQYGEHPALVEALLRHERFVLPPAARFTALRTQRYHPGNGERLDKALQALEDANPGKLRDVFQGISFNNAPALGSEPRKNDVLRRLLDDLAHPALQRCENKAGAPPHAIGEACEFLMGTLTAAAALTGSGGGSGGSSTGRTPPAVAALLAGLVEPQAGDEICDPVCGTAALLLQCGRLARQRAGGSRHHALYGQEADRSHWALARLNLLLQGEDNHRIEQGNCLHHPRLLDAAGQLKRFDVVIAHLPFRMDEWGAEAAHSDPFGRFRRGVPPRTKGHYAFILHMVETLKAERGRMAVVVPHGVLFRGAAEGRIRRRLVEENLLDAVIGLPGKLFPGTAMAAAVLVLRTRKADDGVLFIDASRDAEPGRHRNALREADLARLWCTAAERQPVPGYAHLATPAEVAAHDFNLNLPRYVQALATPPESDAAARRRERAQLHAELAQLERQMAAHRQVLGHA